MWSNHLTNYQPYPVFETSHDGATGLQSLASGNSPQKIRAKQMDGQARTSFLRGLGATSHILSAASLRSEQGACPRSRRQLKLKYSASQDQYPRRPPILLLEVPAAWVPLLRPSHLSLCHPVIFLLRPPPFWLMGTAPRPVHSAWVIEIGGDRWAHCRVPGDHHAVDPSHPDL